jgi:para-nitrobenzyl esterase
MVDALPAEQKAAVMAAFDPNGAGDKQQIANDMTTRQYMTEPDRAISRDHSKTGEPVYTYYFSYVTPAARAAPQGRGGAAHTAEIKYAFAGPKQQFADVDLPLAKAVNAYWAAFIKTGNPDSAGGPAWPKFSPRETYMEFGADGPQPHDHFLKAQLDWEEARVKAGAGASPSAPPK